MHLELISWICAVNVENQDFTDENNEKEKKKSKLKQETGLQRMFLSYNISE